MQTSVFLTLSIAFICGIAVTINFGVLFFNEKYPNAGMWLCLFVGIALMVMVPMPIIPIDGITFHDMPPYLHVLIARISLSLIAIYTFAIGMVTVATCFLVLSGLAKLSKKKGATKEAVTR